MPGGILLLQHCPETHMSRWHLMSEHRKEQENLAGARKKRRNATKRPLELQYVQ